MTIDPIEHDTKTAELHEQAAKIEAALRSHRDRMHGMAGDRKSYVGRDLRWKMTAAQVWDQLRALMNVHGDTFDVRYGLKPSEALAREQEKVAALAGVMGQIGEMEKVYREHRWTRYFPCLNADGHIHSSYRACPSVRFDTAMAWYPQLSGKTVEDAVAELGPTLCSICFALAPVEWCRSKSELNAKPVCEGSGANPTTSTRRGMRYYAACPHCGHYGQLTPSGLVRKHQPKEA